jgi:UV DNA damage endonuclease
VLNSEDERTRRLAVEELEVQAELMDAMGLGPEAVAVLHVGGATGGVDAALERFEQGFELLSPAARARLAVENDDRSFGLGDVLRLSEQMDARSCGTPFTTAATTRTQFPPERRSPLRLRRGRPG